MAWKDWWASQHPGALGWLGGGWRGHCHLWSLVSVHVQLQEKASALGQALLCSGQTLAVLPRSALLWGDVPPPKIISGDYGCKSCVCRTVKAWAILSQDPASSNSAKKFPRTQKTDGQFLKNSINPKTFLYFIGYELWIPTHYFPVEICC